MTEPGLIQDRTGLILLKVVYSIIKILTVCLDYERETLQPSAIKREIRASRYFNHVCT